MTRALPSLRPARLAVLALLLGSSLAHAQGGLRLTRPAPWTPDSTVKGVLNSGSAQLSPDPPIDETIPRIWHSRAERTKWKQTADYDETIRYCRQLEAGSRWIKLE